MKLHQNSHIILCIGIFHRYVSVQLYSDSTMSGYTIHGSQDVYGLDHDSKEEDAPCNAKGLDKGDCQLKWPVQVRETD